ncbi:unnamed protein product [Chrysoparadoxa australica]
MVPMGIGEEKDQAVGGRKEEAGGRDMRVGSSSHDKGAALQQQPRMNMEVLDQRTSCCISCCTWFSFVLAFVVQWGIQGVDPIHVEPIGPLEGNPALEAAGVAPDEAAIAVNSGLFKDPALTEVYPPYYPSPVLVGEEITDVARETLGDYPFSAVMRWSGVSNSQQLSSRLRVGTRLVDSQPWDVGDAPLELGVVLSGQVCYKGKDCSDGSAWVPWFNSEDNVQYNKAVTMENEGRTISCQLFDLAAYVANIDPVQALYFQVGYFGPLSDRLFQKNSQGLFGTCPGLEDPCGSLTCEEQEGEERSRECLNSSASVQFFVNAREQPTFNMVRRTGRINIAIYEAVMVFLLLAHSGWWLACVATRMKAHRVELAGQHMFDRLVTWVGLWTVAAILFADIPNKIWNNASNDGWNPGGRLTLVLLQLAGTCLLIFVCSCFADLPRRFVTTSRGYYASKAAACACLWAVLAAIAFVRFGEVAGWDEYYVTSPESWSRGRQIALCVFGTLEATLTLGLLVFLCHRIAWSFRAFAELPYTLTRFPQLCFRYFVMCMSLFMALWFLDTFLLAVVGAGIIDDNPGFNTLENMTLFIYQSTSTSPGAAYQLFITVMTIAWQIYALPLQPGSRRHNLKFVLTEADDFRASRLSRKAAASTDLLDPMDVLDLAKGESKASLLVIERAQFNVNFAKEAYRCFHQEEIAVRSKPNRQERLIDVEQFGGVLIAKLEEPEDDNRHDTHCIVVRHEASGRLIVSWRGTASSKQMKTDLQANKTTVDLHKFVLKGKRKKWIMPEEHDPGYMAPYLAAKEERAVAAAEAIPSLLPHIGDDSSGSACQACLAPVRRLLGIASTTAQGSSTGSVGAGSGESGPAPMSSVTGTRGADTAETGELRVPTEAGGAVEAGAVKAGQVLEAAAVQTGQAVGTAAIFLQNEAEVISGMGKHHYGQVHWGFYASYNRLREQVLAVVKEELLRRPGPLYITGHSLGGALATHCAFDMATNLVPWVNYELAKAGGPEDVVEPIAITVHTYGSPRVGDIRYASIYNELVPNTWRIRTDGDLVTAVPTIRMGFRHVGQCAVVDPAGSGSIVINPLIMERKFVTKNKTSVAAHLFPSYYRALEGCADPITTEEEVVSKIQAVIRSDKRRGGNVWGSGSTVSVGQSEQGEMRARLR